MALPHHVKQAPRKVALRLASSSTKRERHIQDLELLFKTLMKLEAKGEVLSAYVGYTALHMGIKVGKGGGVTTGFATLLEASLNRSSAAVDQMQGAA